MGDVRKILVIFLIGILYAIFVTSLIDAIYPSPRYEDYCRMPQYAPAIAKPDIIINCSAIEPVQCQPEGMVQYSYDSNGCAVSSYCDYCNKDLQTAQSRQKQVMFIISSIMALIAFGIGLLLPSNKNNLNEWIGTGFLLGGLITLFVGTAQYYADMTRIIRPIVIFIELLIVIFLAYKKLKK